MKMLNNIYAVKIFYGEGVVTPIANNYLKLFLKALMIRRTSCEGSYLLSV